MAVSVTGIREVKAKLKALENGFKYAKPVLDEIADSAIKNFKQNFKEKGKRLEAPWPARKRSYPHPLMLKSRTLQKGFKKESVTNKKAVITNPVEYAKYHQFGTSKLPVRKIVGFSKAIKAVIVGKFTKYIRKIIYS